MNEVDNMGGKLSKSTSKVTDLEKLIENQSLLASLHDEFKNLQFALDESNDN